MTDAEAWTERTTGRERVREVVETLDEPATVAAVASAAEVAWATADSELDRLVADGRVRRRSVDGETRYEPDPVRQFLDQVLALIEDNDRAELEAQLTEYQSRLESLRERHGAGSASEFRTELARGDHSAAEMRELHSTADTWAALETERRLYEQALNLYEDVSRLAGDDRDALTA